MQIPRKSFLAGAAALMVAPAARVLGDQAPNAYVFCRPGGAPIFGNTFGHVGFAYQSSGFEYLAGSVEMVHGNSSPAGKNFWYAQTPDPIAQMSIINNVGVGVETRYDYYKELTGLGNAAAARRAVARVAALQFSAPGSDCLDAVRMVLTQYGVSFTKAQRETPFPNHFFFDLLPGDPQPINAPWPGTVVDASFYTAYGRMSFRDDVLSTTDAVIFDNDISYDPSSDYPQVPWSGFVARRGYLALYSDPNFQGQSTMVLAGTGYDTRQLPYGRLGSFVLASTAFDLSSPPVQGLSPRFASRAERSANYEAITLLP